MATAVVASAGALRFGNPTDEELLQKYRPPAFDFSYVLYVHPKFSSSLYREKIEKWLKHHKVDTIFSPKMYQMLLTMDIPAFAARLYSEDEREAPEWGLEWGCKFLFMLWIWDDVMDSTDIGKSPETALSPLLDVLLLMMWSFPDDPVLRTYLEPFLDQFEGQAREEKARYIDSSLAEARAQPGTVYPKPISGIICDVYLEFWKDVISKASPETCRRLARTIQQWLVGVLEESIIRKGNTVPPSVDNYILMRRRTSAVPPTFVILDVVYGLNTPAESWYNSREMEVLMDAINDVVAWHNDLWSFKRVIYYACATHEFQLACAVEVVLICSNSHPESNATLSVDILHTEVLVQKETANMVLQISVDRKISYAEAVKIATQMVYDRVSDLERAAKDLESITPPEYQRTFELYVLTCRNYISGGEDWNTNNIRYK